MRNDRSDKAGDGLGGKESWDGEEIVFRYSRERRLQSASERAQRLASGELGGRRGLLKSLTATRALTVLFFTVAFLVLANLIVGLVALPGNHVDAAGHSFSVSAFRYDGTLYVTLSRERRAQDAYVGLGSCAATVGKKEAGTYQFRVSDAPSEAFRFSIEDVVDAKTVKVVLHLGSEEGTLTASIR